MSASAKIRNIESKITALQAKHQQLFEQRQRDIVALIAKLDLANIDDKILVGALMFIKEKVTFDDQITKAWLSAGDRFLRRNRRHKTVAKNSPANQSSSQSTEPRETQNAETKSN